MSGGRRASPGATRTRRSETSADLGGQLADDVAETRGNLRVLPGVLTVQRLELHRQFQVLDDARPGEPERLAGPVGRPPPAVPAEGPADDRRRLSLQRAVPERA